MGTQAAGKKAIAERNLNLIALAQTTSPQRTSYQLRPNTNVILGISHDRRAPGGAGGSVDAGDLVLSNGKHPEGVLRAKGFLVGEREQRKVREFLEVIWMDALLIKRTAVVRDVVVRVAKLVLRARNLQRDDFIAGSVFNSHLGAVMVGEDVKRCGHVICLSFRGVGITTPF